MKEKNIRELAKRMGLVTVEDMCQYTIAQLVVKIANKVNELVGEVWRFETDVQEMLKTQNENIQYLLGEGLHLEVATVFEGWMEDGTFDTLINQTALKKVNDRIDETNAHLSYIESTNTIITGVIPLTINPTFDNAPIIQEAINNLNPYERLTLPKGEYNCLTTIDMTRLAEGTKIDFQGVLRFTGNINGVILSPFNSEIYFQGIRGTYGSYKDMPESLNNVGLTIISGNKSNIHIKELYGFKTGCKLIGNGVLDEESKPTYRTKGMIYCDVKIDYINAKTGFYVTKEYGYVNENVIYLKWVDAYDGVKFANNDTWSDPFNNNRFMFTGLENIENHGFILDGCRQTLIFSPRFEIVGGKCIVEKTGCSGNMFIIDYPLHLNQVELNGLRRIWHGNLGANSSYEPVMQLQLSDWTSQPININAGYQSEMMNDTIFFDNQDGVRFDKIFCKVKKSDGTIGSVYFDDFTTDGKASVKDTEITISRDIRIVKASSPTATTTVKTSVEMEQEGYSFYLVTKYMTQPIQVKKSTGTVSIPSLTTIGVYQVMFINGGWKALRISEDADTWYF